MATLTWDAVGERIYEFGVDRGVLGLSDGSCVVWNGLIGVEDSPSSDLKSYYLDGVKFLDHLTPGDFVGKLTAYTYPDEFEPMNGVNNSLAPGFSVNEQKSKKFNLSYRTRKGNDVAGNDLGYILHFLYNLKATPDTRAYKTLEESSAEMVEFSWALTGTPVAIQELRPAVHVTLDSTEIDSGILSDIEDILYGTVSTDPRFPEMDELASFFGYVGNLIITDNGDGTWTAKGMAGHYITMISPTQFQITNVDAVYSDANTYDASSTYAGWT